ncbi:UDP-N-acetylglucosamine 2-epimerase [Virgibacillus halodenitrificans]|uniref:UDP-N-acetylglucosamine 2-epimerase n=1 Tax=Virgibacillus halodenitrificans TaxID=1482 RepID=UPI001F3857DB|nr:UDP-N-acetylglucosamine 2-epimerase [Virgibacillus halodenitrificans]
MKKVCVVTGTRAEYGLLRPLIKRIEEDQDLELQIIATGMHLSPEFGMTYREIEKDGVTINEKVEILLSSDSSVGISKSMGLAMISFSESLARLKPDLLVVLGDRYEIFAVASAASVMKIPVAHLHGGETTEGAFDEAFRHSITKMSYFHFTSTEEYRNRVIQLGENPSRVFNVGAIGIENIMMLDLLAKSDLEESIDFDLRGKFALVTFHPVTLENSTSKEQFKNLLDALDQFTDLKVIFTKSNSDTDGRIINQMIDDYVMENKDRTIAFTSMGQLRYLSAMSYTDIVIGNSSSGIIEAPSFHVPTVNIGDRQKGRIQAESTVNCKPVTEEIKAAIMKVLDPEFKEAVKHVSNPYGNGCVSSKIMDQIKPLLEKEVNIKKSFYNLKR